ncbi:tripartite tricarboxylate transporter substrate binding protein [Pseudoroseomonas cervicalis]|uniref:Bug family tripartite tricarboxylate transporter substrate binding protein n=1 Tax=Teichococcus cervicalis TaxID=204525 RepID=UPI002786A9F9|nr:tripartite tricarboxylate transporter substrate binding protein [Pseudoroseomonas cervicalis]MDQ1079777.1 tripartite-type tricarboxylate transporter receptor subunit TctC [Pseudoroseomonas cervicalis]
MRSPARAPMAPHTLAEATGPGPSRLALSRRALGRLALAGAALPFAAGPALAAFPDRTITIIVPFAPAGATDLAGRVLADRMGPLLVEGGRAVVENKPGAGSALGADFVRRARPDGYTLLVGSASTLAVAPAAQPKVARYNPAEDFTPIAVVGTSAMGLVVPTASGIRSVPQLVARLREGGGRDGYASSGVGGVAHLAGALFSKLAEAPANHIPYRGGSSVAEALMKQEVLFAIDQIASIVGQIRDGALTLLAVTTRARDRNFPDVPTLAEAGVAEYELSTWTALVGPKDMPADIAAALNRAANAALREPAVRERLSSSGTDPRDDSTPDSTRAFLTEEFAWFQAVVARTGLQID